MVAMAAESDNELVEDDGEGSCNYMHHEIGVLKLEL